MAKATSHAGAVQQELVLLRKGRDQVRRQLQDAPGFHSNQNLIINIMLCPHLCRLRLIQVVDQRERGEKVILISGFLYVPVCSRDGGQVRPVAFTGGGCRSRQGGAAQPAGGGEEVGDPAAVMMGAEIWVSGNTFGEPQLERRPDDCPCLTGKWKICSSVWKRRASPKETWR